MLERILGFISLLNKFRNIERTILVNGSDRLENDAEHSYHLAMLAWYLARAEKLDLDMGKVLKYALAHDLVEAHAGDTYIFGDESHRATKEEREAAALAQIKAEFPDFPELGETIEQYEHRADREARFVYALDKIQPMLQIYADDGRTWKKKGIVLEELLKYKIDKVAVSPELAGVWDAFVAELRKREPELFRPAEA